MTDKTTDKMATQDRINMISEMRKEFSMDTKEKFIKHSENVVEVWRTLNPVKRIIIKEISPKLAKSLDKLLLEFIDYMNHYGEVK